jgi:hypothetical protein
MIPEHEEAAIRLAIQKVQGLMRGDLVKKAAAYERKGVEGAASTMQVVLASEVGMGAASWLLGMAPVLMPEQLAMFSRLIPGFDCLATELRISGLTAIGDELADLVMAPFRAWLGMVVRGEWGSLVELPALPEESEVITKASIEAA